MSHLEHLPMNGYVVIFKGKQIDIYADSLYLAKLKAIEKFKPSMKMESMIIVMLAEKDSKQVIHSPDF
jgi:hypothetical protein